MSGKTELFLAASLDVEEEGLFSGCYAHSGASVTNTAQLTRLEPLFERGIRPTLFCTYSVLTDRAAQARLARLSERHELEIGAHLHHWNTPPLDPAGDGASSHSTLAQIATQGLPLPLMAAKLKNLFDAGRQLQARPLTSFRMGRWDLRGAHWPLLAQTGVLCDASVRPLHFAPSGHGPDHFAAPHEPYWVQVEGQRIFEVPLTVTPLATFLPRIAQANRRSTDFFKKHLRHWGVLALLPVYHPLWAMQAITRLYVRRGGKALSLTWHSSEMQPGATPHLPDEDAVKRLLDKIIAYVDWLSAHWEIRHMTMTDMRETVGNFSACPCAASPCDWTTGIGETQGNAA